MTRFAAPAKLNLFLHIVGRRDDGYHLLQTVFRFIDLCDWIDIKARADGQIRRLTDLPGVPADEDLAIRAARLLQQASGSPLGADIAVEKHIPLGSGLGGGSSDAATVLLALNRLWDTRLSLEALAALGLQLGADVPVFVHGRNAWAEGVGEQLSPIDLPQAWYVVISPAVNVPTAQIFSDPELTRSTNPLKITPFSAGPGLDQIHNDLEPVVRKSFPVVAQALDWLGSHGDARMSGSGASVFLAVATEQQAQAIARRIPPVWRGYAVKGLDRHPLHPALNSVDPFRVGSRQAG